MANTEPTSPVQSFFERILQDNPLALGILALALGTLVGLLLPETRQENVLLGPKRDQLAQQAHDTVKDMAQKVTVVAQTAQDAAQDALGKASDAAKDALTEAIGTVKDEAQHQGLPVGA